MFNPLRIILLVTTLLGGVAGYAPALAAEPLADHAATGRTDGGPPPVVADTSTDRVGGAPGPGKEPTQPKASRKDNRLTILDGVVVPGDSKVVSIGGTARRAASIRMGPGPEHAIVRRVAPGALLFATARTSNGWYLLAEEGRAYGYIAGELFAAQRR